MVWLSKKKFLLKERVNNVLIQENSIKQKLIMKLNWTFLKSSVDYLVESMSLIWESMRKKIKLQKLIKIGNNSCSIKSTRSFIFFFATASFNTGFGFEEISTKKNEKYIMINSETSFSLIKHLL